MTAEPTAAFGQQTIGRLSEVSPHKNTSCIILGIAVGSGFLKFFIILTKGLHLSYETQLATSPFCREHCPLLADDDLSIWHQIDLVFIWQHELLKKIKSSYFYSYYLGWAASHDFSTGISTKKRFFDKFSDICTIGFVHSHHHYLAPNLPCGIGFCRFFIRSISTVHFLTFIHFLIITH